MMPQEFVRRNVPRNELGWRQSLCVDDGGEFRAIPEDGDRFTTICTIPDERDLAQRDAIADSPAADAEASRRIAVGAREADALARVAQSEVGHFGMYGADTLRGGLAAVVDTVFNRVAHRRFPSTIEGVIDQPMQFSAINATGNWESLQEPRPPIWDIVERHLVARSSGTASEIKGATHFLNPHRSSTTAMANWGQHVVDNAVESYGSEDAQDIHYHGFAPGISTPSPYVISYNGREALFDVLGRATSGRPSLADLRVRIVEVSQQELAFFESGRKKEHEDPQYKRIGDYWSVVDQPYDGRTKLVNASSGDSYNPAWSAVFVSWVMETAGADGFPSSQAHCHYFQSFVDAPDNALCQAASVSELTPKAGDIVHYGRETAKQYDFGEARGIYGADRFYPSHSDIVVDVDTGAGLVTTIGGNLGNSVREQTFQLDGNGLLASREESGRTYPWIGLLRLRG